MALGFETKGRGGYRVQWNKDFELSTNIGDSKQNTFGNEKFDVLFSIWMIENKGQCVRGIWLPTSDPWQFDSAEAMVTLGDRLLDGILHSAVALAVEKWGAPLSPDIADLAVETPLEVARSTGGWHIPGVE